MCNIYTGQKQLSFPGEEGSGEFIESTNSIEWFDTKPKILFRLNWRKTIEGQTVITQIAIGAMRLALVLLLLQMVTSVSLLWTMTAEATQCRVWASCGVIHTLKPVERWPLLEKKDSFAFQPKTRSLEVWVQFLVLSRKICKPLNKQRSFLSHQEYLINRWVSAPLNTQSYLYVQFSKPQTLPEPWIYPMMD